MKASSFLAVVLLLLALLCLVIATGLAQAPQGQSAPRPASVEAPGLAEDAANSVPLQASMPAQPNDCSFLTMTHTTAHFNVYYNLADTPQHTNVRITTPMAQAVGDALEEAFNIYVNDPNFRFRRPAGTGTAAHPERLAVCCMDLPGRQGGRGGWNSITGQVMDNLALDSQALRNHFSDPLWYPLQCAHELFHRVQYSYDRGPENDWTLEGTANTMQDKILVGPGNSDSDPNSNYLDRVNEYLAAPDQSLLGLDKPATLFWTYYMQTCGAVQDEPELGMDALRLFWEQTLAYDGVDAMDHAIQLAPNCPDLDSMEDLFHEFIIANYIKRLGNVSPRYQYVDEQGSLGTPYDDVAVEYGPEPLGLGTNMDHDGDHMTEFSARYYVGEPDAACDWVQVELDGLSWAYMLYAIAGVDGGNALYYDVPWMRGRGNHFLRTVYSDGLDEVVAIVGTADSTTNYDIEMRCIARPTLEILSPQPYPLSAFAGHPLNPRPFLIRVSVTSDDYPVAGLVPEAFTVRVGQGEAEVLSAQYVEDQYWLVVRPPAKPLSPDPGPWLYDLSVALSGTSDSVTNGVHYNEQTYFDRVLVLDISGSMAGAKLAATRNAAKLLVDELIPGDYLGAVRFGDYAISMFNGMHGAGTEFRAYAKTTLDGLTTEGCTRLGHALQLAVAEFDHEDAPSPPQNPNSIILLSDGGENLPPCWRYSPEPWTCGSNDCRTGPYVRQEIISSTIPINAIALGPGAAEDLMQDVADATHGQYVFAAISDTVTSAVSTSGADAAARPQQVSDWELGLLDVYDYLGGLVAGRTRIYHEQVSALAVATTYSRPVTIDPSISSAVFAVAHDVPSASIEHKVWLRRPNGEEIVPANLPPGVSYRLDEHHNVYTVSAPEPGEWQVLVYYLSTPGRPPPPYDFLILVSGESASFLDVHIGAPAANRLTGSHIPLTVAFLGPSGLLPGATMQGFVVANGTQVPITLRDDGRHADGSAGDGVYGAYFNQTTAEGSYTLVVQGQEGDTTRQVMTSFHVQAGADTDGDGLPDGWEERNGLDPGQDDASEDPDWDMLDNAREYDLGTDPHNADSDGGGQADNSEVLFGTDPVNNPDDDAIETPTSFRAIAGDEQVVLRYDRRENVDFYWLHWSTDPEMCDAELQYIQIDPTGVYSHTGLTNGTTYYYVLRAFHQNHYYEISDYTGRVSATPRADPIPPGGTVVINDNAAVAASRDAVLSIEAVDDDLDEEGPQGPRLGPPADMRIANDQDLTGATWEPFATTREWRLAGRSGEQTYVYVQFRDAEGNVSPLASDGIVLELPEVPGVYLPIILRNFVGLNWETEPNDEPEQADGPLVSDKLYNGQFPSGDDLKDYWYFDMAAGHTIEIWLTDIPHDHDYDLVLLDAGLEEKASSRQMSTRSEHILTGQLPAGWYYVQVLNEGQSGSTQSYKLRVIYE